MWYWVCESDKSINRIAYSVKGCFNIKSEAKQLMYSLAYENASDANYDIWIKTDEWHADRNYKQFRCPDCGNMMSQEELDRTWDWGGPSCSACGCTGVTMFAAVHEKKPIMNSRGAILSALKEVRDYYKAIFNRLTGGG